MNRVQQFVFLAMTPLLWLLTGSAGNAAEKVIAPFTQVLDTHKRLMPGAAAEAALGHAGWKVVQEDVVDYTFAGDAAIANDKVTAVVQQANGTVELYARQRLLAGPCVTLVPLQSGVCVRPEQSRFGSRRTRPALRLWKWRSSTQTAARVLLDCV